MMLFVFFALILVLGILSLILVVAYLRTKKSKYILSLIGVWSVLVMLGVTISFIKWAFFTKTRLGPDDYQGEYIIDRTMFPGPDADWQYNHFRFVIRDDDSLFFYRTNGEEVLETYRGVARTTILGDSRRLILQLDNWDGSLDLNPTTYRDVWSFYLVFHSKFYHNMYFVKGKWRRID